MLKTLFNAVWIFPALLILIIGKGVLMFCIRLFKVNPKAAQYVSELRNCDNNSDFQKLSEKINSENFSDIDCDLVDRAAEETVKRLNEKIQRQAQKEAEESDNLRIDRVRRFRKGKM